MLKKHSGLVIVIVLLVSVQVACSLLSSPQGEDELLSELATVQAEQATKIAKQDELLSYLFTEMPRNTPDPRGPVTPVPTEFSPVVGSVVINEDRCCVGGAVGETVELNIQFDAMSPSGDITHMRYKTGLMVADKQQLQQEEWQVYREAVVEEFEITTSNWVGFWVTVQYMDAEGNVSPLFVDDISIEGHQEQPTASP